jgi:hypothetical protein
MMCSIHIDESAIHVLAAARLSHLCVPFFEKLDNLLAHLDNWHMMHGSRNNALEWVRMDRKNAHYYGAAMLHRLFIPLLSGADSHLALLHFLLRVSSLFLHLESMEDKRGTKRSRSPSKEGFSLPSMVSTTLPVPSGSPPPLQSLPEVSSHHHCSPVFEQGGCSRKAPVVDLSSSSDEEGLILDTSWDEEFTRRLFGDLNRDVLRPPGDNKVIILSDSDEEEEEVHEENATDVKTMPFSATRVLASTTSTADADEAPKGGARRY